MERHTRPRRAARLALLASIAGVAVGTVLMIGALAGSGPAPSTRSSTAATPDTTAPPHRVTVFYFHTTNRCSSCRKIEAYTRNALGTGFAAELADGRLVWKMVNVDDKENKHFVKDYELYTKSVILSDERMGSQVRWKNLAKVWELLGNEAAFVGYVQTETRAYLTEEP